MAMDKNKLISYCHKVIEVSIYGLVFFMPISKAFIEIFITIMLMAWVISKIVKKEKLSRLFYPTYLNLPILLYILAVIASTFFSSNFNISFRHLVFKTLEYLMLFFIVVEAVDKRILRNVLIIIVFSAGLLSIDGIFQYFAKWDFLRQRNIVVPVRINASFAIANDFSAYIVTVLPLVTGISFVKFKRRWIKMPVITICIMLFICLILSATRSAWLSVLSVIPFAMLLRHKRFALFILLLILPSVFFLTLFSNSNNDRVINILSVNETGTYTHRRYLLQIGLNMFKDKPLLGQGLGTFMYNFRKFQPGDYLDSWGICYAHNCFLQILAETGITGFLTFILIITVLFFVTYKKIRKIKEGHFYYNISSGFLIGIFAYLIDSFFDTNLYSLQLAVLFWMMVALTAAISKIIETESTDITLSN